jgi:hypothetical protein
MIRPALPCAVSGNGLEPMFGGKCEQLGSGPSRLLLAAFPLAHHASRHVKVGRKYSLLTAALVRMRRIAAGDSSNTGVRQA